MKTVDLIAGARPNFMKIAPLYYALKQTDWCSPRIIHTGQHYSDELWKVFLNDFGIAEPFANLNAIPPGSNLGRLEQVELVDAAYEKFCRKSRPDFVVVVGDVNSTLGAARCAQRLGIPCGHVEAGLRSFDLSMPEEHNRLETDRIVQFLWTPSEDGDRNLRKEGVPGEIEMVGNIMIDAFVMLREKIEKASVGFGGRSYCVITLHRPANVDHTERLRLLVRAIEQIAPRIDISFPIHPRTRKRLGDAGLLKRLQNLPGVHIKEPQSYINFMAEVCKAKFLITDSGGVQEETTFLKIPCLTVRENTERPVTVEIGSNELISPEQVPDGLIEKVEEILSGKWLRKPRIPPLWDGNTASRIKDSLEKILLCAGNG